MQNIITPDFSQTLRTVEQPSPKEMLRVMRDGAQTHVRINSSSLSLIQTCARKSFYTLKQRLRSRAGSPPLIFGSAMHKALEVFYNQPRGLRTMPVNFTEYAAVMAHGHNAPEPHFLYDAVAAFVTAAEPLQMLPDTDPRSLSSGIWVLGHYFQTYLNDTYEIYSDEQGPFTERTFSFALVDTPSLLIELFGTIDFILRNTVTGALLPGDHKTSSRMGSEFLNRTKPNHQYTGYLMGANRALGLNCENFMVNGIQVIRRPLTSRGGPPTFTRQITHRSADDFAEFTQAIEWAVHSYLRWEDTGVWPIGSVDACALWRGCPFLDVCSAPNELRQNILEAKYERPTL